MDLGGEQEKNSPLKLVDSPRFFKARFFAFAALEILLRLTDEEKTLEPVTAEAGFSWP